MDASGGRHRGGQSRAAKKRAKKRDNENRKRRLDQQEEREHKGHHVGDKTEEEETATTTTRGPDLADEEKEGVARSGHQRRRRRNDEGGENGRRGREVNDGDGSATIDGAGAARGSGGKKMGRVGNDGGGGDESSASSSASSARAAAPPPTLAEIIRSLVSAEGDGGGGEKDGGHDRPPLSNLTVEERGRLILRSILHPAVTVEEFYDTYWEKLPLHVSAAAVSPSSSEGNDGGTTSSKVRRSGHGDDGNQHAVEEPTAAHHGRHRLDGLFSMRDIEDMISEKCLRYTYDLNVTKCDESTGTRRVNFDYNGESGGGMKSRKVAAAAPCVGKYDRDDAAGETDGGNDRSSSPPEVVDPESVWPRFRESGCTIRMLCPQKHVDTLHAVLSTLESEFGCMVGCNAYLTPGRASRGFAPHYDDIEAFVLQVEGEKRWRVYRPINGGETLPRVSSDDFVMAPSSRRRRKDDDSDSDDGGGGGLAGRRLRGGRGGGDGRRRVEDDPVLDVTLGPGDVLYMPRGWIHHAVTPGGGRGHSLHLTVSCMQNWAWADLMELVVPEALAAAVQSETSTRLRGGLSRNFLSYMGAVHDTTDGEDIEGLKQAEELQSNGNDSPRQEKGRDLTKSERKKEKLRQSFKDEAKKCINRICNEAISMLDAGCDQIGKRFLSDRLPPALTERERSTTSDGARAGKVRVMPDTMCRLVREGIARLVLEDGRAVLYHCADNSREFHGNPLSPMEFELDDAPAIEQLLTCSTTEWIRVQDLTHDEIEDKIGIAQALFDEGILSIYQQTA